MIEEHIISFFRKFAPKRSLAFGRVRFETEKEQIDATVASGAFYGMMVGILIGGVCMALMG